MHCQVPGIDYSLSKLAIHAALESATAIGLSHTGVLYIAETDEKKINRVRQVGGEGRQRDTAATVVVVVVRLPDSPGMNWLRLKLICWLTEPTAQLARAAWVFSSIFKECFRSPDTTLSSGALTFPTALFFFVFFLLSFDNLK